MPGVRIRRTCSGRTRSSGDRPANEPVQLDGVTAGLVGMEGAATQNLGSGALLIARWHWSSLRRGTVDRCSAGIDRRLLVNGYAHTVRVRAVLGEGTIGALAGSGVTVVLLPYAQTLTGQQGRVTNVLIRTQPGKTRQVATELRDACRQSAGRGAGG